MDKIRVAFIGCGQISELHYKAYEKIDDAEVVMLCDRNPELLNSRMKEWGIALGTDRFEDVLENPDIDAVEILTPQKLHEDMVIRALRAGKHVAVQKPMSIDLHSADRMIREAEKTDRIFKITENFVTYPPIVKARRLIDDGAIGEPINFRLNLIGAGKGGWDIPKSAWEWRMQELLEDRGQEAFDHGHHLWSTAWYLMGDFAEVSAWLDYFEDMIDAPDMIMWKYREGQRYGSCSISYCNEMYIDSEYYSNDEWIDITGTRGILRINRCTGKLLKEPVLSLYREGEWTCFEEIPSDWQLGFTGAAVNFVRAIRGEEAPFPSPAQGRAILAMNMAIQKSSAKRRVVYLDELDHPVPGFYAFLENRRRVRTGRNRKKRLLRDMRQKSGSAGLESRAEELTMSLPGQVRPEEIRNWKASIGLILQRSDKGEDLFSITIADDDCRIESGSCPENADLTIRVPKTIWAAILSGRQKIQTAFIQGKFKMDGDIEYGFKLKSVFGL